MSDNLFNLARFVAARASSATPGGAYSLDEVLLHNFAHSPDARLQPDGSIVVYHIYNSSASTCTNCSGGVSGTGPGCVGWRPGTQFFGYWGALHAPSAAGPWTSTRLGSCDPASADYVPGCAANGNDLKWVGVGGELPSPHDARRPPSPRCAAARRA